MFRKSVLALVVAVGIAVLGLFVFRRQVYPQQVIKSCLTDAGGIRPGAGVRIAGVDVGTVGSVRAHA